MVRSRNAVNARIRPVEQPQAVSAGRAGKRQRRAAVGEYVFAEKAHHAAHHSRAHCVLVHQLVRGIESAVGEHDGNVALALRQPRRALFVVAHQEQSGQAAVDLGPRESMRMRMEPVGAGAIADFEFIDVLRTRGDHIARMAVHLFGHDQPVPVHDARLRYLVLESDADLLSCVQADDRTRVAAGNRLQRACGAPEHAAGVAPHRRGRARQ